ncbi:dihydrodipicolinate reductase C-terminal domain-containing protein [Patescibacteria group bacterium]
MKKMKVMVNGLPGKMATLVAEAISKSKHTLVRKSFTGPDINDNWCKIGGTKIQLFRPPERGSANIARGTYVIDFTLPTAALENVQWYCDRGNPFVMGTTGVVFQQVHDIVMSSRICAVYAPNMAKQIVALMAMLEYVSREYKGVFEEFDLVVVESHQETKVDFSGTASKIIEYFELMGVVEADIARGKVRDVGMQLGMGVPREHLAGHGWHRYELVSRDGSMRISLTHDINGRAPYIQGTMDALHFLQHAVEQAGMVGQTYSMHDVLRG